MKIIKIIISVFAIIMLVIPIIEQGHKQLDKDIVRQQQYISELEQEYASGDFKPVDEASFFDGDLNKALGDGIKFNEMAFIATHNSYEPKSVHATKLMYDFLSNIVPDKIAAGTGLLNNESLTKQLNCGIRSLELDIETVKDSNGVSFRCMHSPVIDMTTNCYDFGLTLKELSMWSDNNPNHLPITILIEPKTIFLPMKNMRFFNIEYAKAFDSCLRENLGDKLFTPADMLRDYNSFKEMRENDDWCKVSDMLGKFLFILHPTDNITDEYINLDTSVKTQAMFPALTSNYADKSYTSIILINNPNEAVPQKDRILKDCRLVVRTRADEFPTYSDERRELAMQSCSQIMTTDFPVKTTSTASDYVVTFENSKTVRRAF